MLKKKEGKSPPWLCNVKRVRELNFQRLHSTPSLDRRGARGPQKATCDPKARQLCWALWGRRLFCYTRLSFQGSERSAESQVHFQTWLDLSLPFLPQNSAICGAWVTSLCQCLRLGHLMLMQLYSLSMRFYFLVWMGHTHVTKDFQPVSLWKVIPKKKKKSHFFSVLYPYSSQWNCILTFAHTSNSRTSMAPVDCSHRIRITWPVSQPDLPWSRVEKPECLPSTPGDSYLLQRVRSYLRFLDILFGQL